MGGGGSSSISLQASSFRVDSLRFAHLCARSSDDALLSDMYAIYFIFFKDSFWAANRASNNLF
jgi:hypothetical protein